MDTRCLSSCRTKFVVNLHPSQALSVMAGVRSHLNSLLLRWSDDLEGVALSYTGERILSSQARIHPYFPYLELHAEAEMLTFGPKAGQALVGRVVRVAGDYLALLVLDTFNAAIARQLIPPSFRFQPGREEGQGAWVQRTDPSKRIVEGSHVLFAVKRVQTEGDFFSLLGSLEPPWAGPVASPAQEDLPGSLPSAGISLLPPQPPAAEANRGGPPQRRVDPAAPAAAPAGPADSGVRKSGEPSGIEQGVSRAQPEGTEPGGQAAKEGKKKKRKRRREAEPEPEPTGAASGSGQLVGAGQRHDRQGGGAAAAAGSTEPQVAATGSSEPQLAPQPVMGVASQAAALPGKAKKRQKQLQPEAAQAAATEPSRSVSQREPSPPRPEVPAQQAAGESARGVGGPAGMPGGKGRKEKEQLLGGDEPGSAGQVPSQAEAGKQAPQKKKKKKEKSRTGDEDNSSGAAGVAQPENGAREKPPAPGLEAKEPMGWLLSGKKRKKLKAEK